MKPLKTTLLITLLFSFFLTTNAQKRYQVHLDNVRPSMVGEYEQIAKEFVDICKKYNPQAPWVTAVTNDNMYMYISPMENFAELDKNQFADIAKDMGDDWGKIFTRFDKCYDSHSDYVITLNESLTYMPEGISQTQDGLDYRKWYFLYHTPENGNNLYNALKSIKDLFASKGSKEYYRVYHSGFGSPESYFLVALSSKDEIDGAMASKANQKLLGEDMKAPFGNMMKYISRFEEKSGSMRPDLGYSPK